MGRSIILKYAFTLKNDKNKKKCEINHLARMAEWSKAVDLSPTISGCAGSNPASRIGWFGMVLLLYALIAQLVEHHTCNVGVSGSSPDWGTPFFSCPRSSVGRALGF